MTIFGITLTAPDIFLFGPVGTLLVVLIRMRFTSEIRKKDIFNVAAKEFIGTFHRELKEVYPTPVNWPDNINSYLRARFDSLDEAVGKFRNHLSIGKQVPFNNAWFSFYCCTGREVDRNCQCYLHYIPSKGESVENGVKTFHNNTTTYKNDFKKNVETLLKYAELNSTTLD